MTVRQHIESVIRKAGYRLDQVFLLACPELVAALRRGGGLPVVRVLEAPWIPGNSIGDDRSQADLYIMDLRDLPAYANRRRRRIITAVWQGRLA